MPDPYLQTPGMGYPEYTAAPSSHPGVRQYGQIPQLFGDSYYHSGLPVHPMYSQAATGYPQGGAYGLQHTAGAGMPQDVSLHSYRNGLLSPGLVSMLGGLCAAGVIEQETPPPPPLPPEDEDHTPPLPPPPPHSEF